MPRRGAAEMATDVAARDWELWSTTATLVVSEPEKIAAAEVLDEWLDRVDEAANQFRDDSEVRVLPAGRWVELSPTLATLLDRALIAARATDGLVDPTVGGALRALGYDRDLELVIEEGRPVRGIVRPAPGWRRLRLDGRRLLLPEGVTLDLGATAKAVAADIGAAVISERLHTGVLVALGGDVAVAGSPPAGGWRVAVEDHGDRPLGTIDLYDGAIATSSTLKRTWVAGREQVHHIVDPRSGRSARSPYRTATVVARSCLEANAFSTAAIARADEAVTWLNARGVIARLVEHAGHVVSTRWWDMGEAA